MVKILRIIILFLSLITGSNAAFAWHDYTYHDWDWYGSGRDHPYSYYVDNYSPSSLNLGYSPYNTLYIDYINNVTPPPLVPLSNEPMAQVPILPLSEPTEFTVNVPNKLGGYTAVVIKKSGNGYLGPQGEYYPQFPKVSQLSLMYGK